MLQTALVLMGLTILLARPELALLLLEHWRQL